MRLKTVTNAAHGLVVVELVLTAEAFGLDMVFSEHDEFAVVVAVQVEVRHLTGKTFKENAGAFEAAGDTRHLTAEDEVAVRVHFDEVADAVDDIFPFGVFGAEVRDDLVEGKFSKADLFDLAFQLVELQQDADILNAVMSRDVIEMLFGKLDCLVIRQIGIKVETNAATSPVLRHEVVPLYARRSWL